MPRSSLTSFSGAGLDAVDYGRGQQSQTVENAGDDEERRLRDIAQCDAHLAGDDRDIGHRHVEREDQAAGLVGGAFIEPAFDDHEGRRQGESRDDAQEDPAYGIDQQAGQKRNDGNCRRKGRECAHMADTPDQPLGKDAAQHKAGCPGGAQKTERCRREALRRSSHRQQQAMKPLPASRKAVPRSNESTGRRLLRMGIRFEKRFGIAMNRESLPRVR
jgi:hypothetical protein